MRRSVIKLLQEEDFDPGQDDTQNSERAPARGLVGAGGTAQAAVDVETRCGGDLLLLMRSQGGQAAGTLGFSASVRYSSAEGGAEAQICEAAEWVDVGLGATEGTCEECARCCWGPVSGSGQQFTGSWEALPCWASCGCAALCAHPPPAPPPPVVRGCTYSEAINFNPNATLDDQSCLFSSSALPPPSSPSPSSPFPAPPSRSAVVQVNATMWLQAADGDTWIGSNDTEEVAAFQSELMMVLARDASVAAADVVVSDPRVDIGTGGREEVAADVRVALTGERDAVLSAAAQFADRLHDDMHVTAMMHQSDMLATIAGGGAWGEDITEGEDSVGPGIDQLVVIEWLEVLNGSRTVDSAAEEVEIYIQAVLGAAGFDDSDVAVTVQALDANEALAMVHVEIGPAADAVPRTHVLLCSTSSTASALQDVVIGQAACPDEGEDTPTQLAALHTANVSVYANHTAVRVEYTLSVEELSAEALGAAFASPEAQTALLDLYRLDVALAANVNTASVEVGGLIVSNSFTTLRMATSVTFFPAQSTQPDVDTFVEELQRDPQSLLRSNELLADGAVAAELLEVAVTQTYAAAGDTVQHTVQYLLAIRSSDAEALPSTEDVAEAVAALFAVPAKQVQAELILAADGVTTPPPPPPERSDASQGTHRGKGPRVEARFGPGAGGGPLESAEWREAFTAVYNVALTLPSESMAQEARAALQAECSCRQLYTKLQASAMTHCDLSATWLIPRGDLGMCPSGMTPVGAWNGNISTYTARVVESGAQDLETDGYVWVAVVAGLSMLGVLTSALRQARRAVLDYRPVRGGTLLRQLASGLPGTGRGGLDGGAVEEYGYDTAFEEWFLEQYGTARHQGYQIEAGVEAELAAANIEGCAQVADGSGEGMVKDTEEGNEKGEREDSV
ncbi:hypothetical protein CYMTET_43942 [Cymbomonas tetramitiformis]|uniref:Uncharacterized protein n=1 Tax=Cymbomonas tetramitiformis TaxID=36881 RepID=A0AAE0C172_9CHLO|nr:hypothetical protein CYMTET_43942 [Cymbomonas tetramitiformis]